MPGRRESDLLRPDNERKNEAIESDIGKLLAARGKAGMPIIRNPAVTSQVLHIPTLDI